MQLAEYDYEIVHKCGALKTNADALSRVGSISRMTDQIGIPDEGKRKEILYEFHDSPVGGHRGMNKTYCTIKSHYSWPNMKKEVEEYVKQCRSCQVNKNLIPRHQAPLEITTAERAFEKCYLDVVGPLPVTQGGNRYVLTFQDDLSKYVVGIPIGQQDAETVARAFMEKIVLVYSTPQILQTDQGANFISEVFKNTCEMLRIKKIQSTAFHPELQ
jgi:transposase InsO family protein